MKINRSILYISQCEFHGGAEEMLLRYMEAAKENGFQPVLVLPRRGWLTDECISRNIPFEIVVSIPRPFTYNKWVHFKSWFWNAIQIAALVKKWKAVIVHSNSARAAFHGGLGARLAGIPSIAHVHDVIKSPYSSRVFSTILKYLVDLTICVSHFVEQDVITVAPFLIDSICTIYNGIFEENNKNKNPQRIREKYAVPPEVTLFGVVSAMVRLKGQDHLIKAFKDVNSIHPDTRLMIVGGSQGVPEQIIFEDELKKLVAESGLLDKVIFTGWKENVLDYLHAFNIFTFTPNQPDSLPTVLIHASANGSPIISTMVGGIPEIVIDQQSGLLVEPNNLEQLECAMIKLLDNLNLREQLGKKAKEQYQTLFTFNKMSENLNNCYEQLLSNAYLPKSTMRKVSRK